jgi:hypothetical protein
MQMDRFPAAVRGMPASPGHSRDAVPKAGAAVVAALRPGHQGRVAVEGRSAAGTMTVAGGLVGIAGSLALSPAPGGELPGREA